MKYFEDRVQHNRTLERERETRRALRQDAIVERRTQFQRQTLLELQPALTDLGRYTYSRGDGSSGHSRVAFSTLS
jgi:hypothetical protein